MKTTKKNIRSFVKWMLGHNPAWAKRALIVIYQNQTDDEQNSKVTRWQNDLGFTGVDAEILTSFAQQLKYRGFLSTKQWNILYKRIPKYHKQIMQIANIEKIKAMVEKFEGVAKQENLL